MNKYFTKGIRFMLLSTMVFSFMNAIAKYLEAYSWSEIVFYRSFISLVICAGLLYKNGIPVLGNQRKLLLARGLVGTFAMCCFFAALKILPLTTTVSIRYLSPIFGALFAVYFLKDRIKPIQWLFFLLSFSGVLVLKGFDVRVETLGMIIILFSAVFTGAIYVLIQAIGKRDHPLVVITYFMFFATITGIVFTGKNWSSPLGLDLGLLLALGVLGFFGQLFMTKALQEESTARVAPIKYAESIFVFMIGWVWLGETYTWIPIVGLLMIISGMILNVVFGKRKTIPEAIK